MAQDLFLVSTKILDCTDTNASGCKKTSEYTLNGKAINEKKYMKILQNSTAKKDFSITKTIVLTVHK